MPKGQRPRGATPHPRSGVAAERSYPMSEVRGSGQEETPCERGQGWAETLSSGPLEEGIATHSTILGESHEQRSLVGYLPQGCKKVGQFFHETGKGWFGIFHIRSMQPRSLTSTVPRRGHAPMGI